MTVERCGRTVLRCEKAVRSSLLHLDGFLGPKLAGLGSLVASQRCHFVLIRVTAVEGGGSAILRRKRAILRRKYPIRAVP